MKIRAFQLSLVSAVLLGGLLLCCPVTSHGANPSESPGAKPGLAKERFKNLAEQLNLTDEQKQQLKPILREEAQKLKNLRAQTDLSRRQRRAQLIQIRQDLLARIKPILTPEQLDKWQQLRAQRRGRHHAASQPAAPGP